MSWRESHFSAWTCSLSLWRYHCSAIHMHVKVYTNQIWFISSWDAHVHLQTLMPISSVYMSAIWYHQTCIHMHASTDVNWNMCHVELMPHACSVKIKMSCTYGLLIIAIANYGYRNYQWLCLNLEVHIDLLLFLISLLWLGLFGKISKADYSAGGSVENVNHLWTASHATVSTVHK